MDFDKEEKLVNRLKAEYDSARQSLKYEKTEKKESEEAVKHAEEAQEVLQHLAEAVQQQAHQKISEVVSSCLRSVFDDPYEFKIEFERKRGRTEAKLRFVRNGMEVDPMTASGGGMIDVAAFALRVACLVLHRPRLNRVVVLDEPFRFVSEEYRDNVRQMLESLSHDMGVQIIQITHISELATGKVVEL